MKKWRILEGILIFAAGLTAGFTVGILVYFLILFPINLGAH